MEILQEASNMLNSLRDKPSPQHELREWEQFLSLST